jgi:hypothetical protein
MQSLKLTFVAIALSLSVLVMGQAQDSNPQMSILPKTTEGNGDGICPLGGELEAVRSEIRQEIQNLLEPSVTCGGTTGWTRHSYIDTSVHFR